MKSTMRSYQTEDDHWRIRKFLRSVMQVNDHRDLDIVAVASDGSIACFCMLWFDDVTRTACIEPVATVPAHQRHGLGKAVILESLHRLKHMGCKAAFVGGYSQAANALIFQ